MSNRDLLSDMGYDESTVFESPDYDKAIVGVSTEGNVIYDYDKMVDSLAKDDGMSSEDAVEFIDYNTVRAIPYAPEPKPIIMYRLPEEKTNE